MQESTNECINKWNNKLMSLSLSHVNKQNFLNPFYNFVTNSLIIFFSGASNLLASLRHTGRRRVVLSHTLNTLWHVITKKSHNVLSKFTILCWATFTAILGCMRPAGCRLDNPETFWEGLFWIGFLYSKNDNERSLILSFFFFLLIEIWLTNGYA